MSRHLKRIFWSGVGIFVILVIVALLGVPEWLSENYRQFAGNISKTFYWTIPLIFIIFISPYVIELSRRPDVHITFLEEGGYLFVTVVNLGETPFSFNRVQFFTRRNEKALPENGRENFEYIWPNDRAGFSSTGKFNQEGGLTLRKGIPLLMRIPERYYFQYFDQLLENSYNGPIYLRLYFDQIAGKAESKDALPESFVKVGLK